MKYTKGSFITVPNREELRGLDPKIQCLFMWLCSYANETGQCFPSQEKLSKDTGMGRKIVIKYINELVSMGMVLKKVRKNADGKNMNNIYTVLIGAKDSPEYDGSNRPVGIGEIEDKKPVVVKIKANPAEINLVIDEFAGVNPSFMRLYKNTPQREAVRRIVEQHGLEMILRVVKYLPISNKNTYAPTITTPYDLEKKLGDLFAWSEKQKNKKGKGKEIHI